MFSQRTINYAAPPVGSFWVWSADYDAIEWYDGSTLAMWQELRGVLGHLGEEGGLPPLGAVLLLLAACRNEWISQCIRFHEIVVLILEAGDSDGIDPEIKDTLVRGLKTVNDLPEDLRSPFAAKCLLVSALFEGGPHSLLRKESELILRELSIHGPRGLSGSLPEMKAKARFTRDLRALRVGLARHDASSLETRLRTGLETLSVLPAPLPEVPGDLEDPRLLLDRLLATGGEIGAAAAVARQAIAMVNFPGSFGSPRDLPVGGISDITNRGTVDRLLPGELAWDDLVLAARLVHNEALYFRREIPPMQVVISHTILLDRGLRLWGTARVFALGVALGLRHHPALNAASETFECQAATCEGFTCLELATPAGVYAALEALVPAPRPDAFLMAWWDSVMASDDHSVPDVSFVTAKAHLDDTETRKLIGEIAAGIHGKGGHFRILALGRCGEVEVQAWSPAGIRELFRGQLDLDEIFPPPPPSKPSVPKPPPLRKKPDPLQEMLPVYAEDRLPFLFPQLPQGSAILADEPSPQSQIYGVSSDRRLMRWPRVGWGAQILSAKIPGRQHWLGRDDHGKRVVVASGDKAGEAVRAFRFQDDRLHEIALAASMHPFPRNAVVSGGAVMLAYADSVEALSLATGNRESVLAVKAWPEGPLLDYDGERIHLSATGEKPRPPLERWPFGDPTWPRLFVPDRVALVSGRLSVCREKQTYQFDPFKLTWDRAKPSTSPPNCAFEESTFFPEACVPLKVARLGKKCEAWLDPRGLLHLRNLADRNVPPWSILMSTSATSAWNAPWGLCAMEPRLRFPEAQEPGDIPLRALKEFLAALSDA